MFYRLSPEFALRGWEKLPWTLLEHPHNQVQALSRAEFDTLLLCDGETDLDHVLPSALTGTLSQWRERGWVLPCDAPQPLAADQYYQYFPNRFVQSVFWSVTGRCNYQCRHCYMDAPEGALGELSTQEALDLIDQMAQCGVYRVELTGGEPLVRGDLWQLVDRMLEHGIFIDKVYSNGWLLDKSVLDQFDRRGMKPMIYVSFDGVDGWHDWMRGCSGAEKAALDALKLCHDRGFDTAAQMCIHKGNVGAVPQSVRALRNVGVTRLKASNISMTDLWRRHSDGNAFTQQEYIEAVLPYISWYYEAGRPMEHLEFGGVIDLYWDRPYQLVVRDLGGGEDALDCHLCSTARWSCYITPEGRLLPCLPMTASPQQERFPRVQDIGLRQGLSHSVYLDYTDSRVRDLAAVNQECAQCEHLLRCGGGCRAIALTDGDQQLMGCDRLSCMFWNNHYMDRIRQAAETAMAAHPLP